MRKTTLRRGGGIGLAFIVSLLCLSFLFTGIAEKTAKAVEEYKYPDTSDVSYFVPQITSFNDVTAYEFPNKLNSNFDHQASLITDISGTLDMNRFGITQRVNNADGAAFTANSINYQSWAAQDKGCDYWKYMYGYFQLPAELTQKGGKLTVNADTAAYYDDEVSKCYLSLVAGNQIYGNKTSNLNVTDMQMNTSTGNTSKYDATRTANQSETMPPTTPHSVTIDVRPGDRYARISYVHLMKKSGGWSQNRYGSRIENVTVSYTFADITAPTIANAQAVLNSDYRSATITATVTDPRGVKEEVSGIDNVTIQKPDGTAEQVTITNNEISYTATNNGVHTITATDRAGNRSQETVTVTGIDKTAPVIGNFTGQDTPTAGQVRVSFTITDEGSGIASKSCNINGTAVSIMVTGNTYYFFAKSNGTYRITATDRAGNTATESVTVTGVDNDPPTVSDITGADAVSLYDGKTITFRLSDKNGISTVTFNNSILTPVDGVYSIHVKKNGTYNVMFTDSLGNTGGQNIQVTNCYFGSITAGEGVTITGLTPEGYVAENGTITVKIISSNFGHKLVMPTVANATVTENYNYGLEAEYTVIFSGDTDYTQTINARYEAVMITVQVNGATESFAFGSVQTFTASEPALGQRFVGWYDKNGVMICSNKIADILISSANSYAARYVNEDETMITYLNLADKLIDIKGVKLNGQTLEQYLESQTTVTAPVNAYMVFAGWLIVSYQDGEAVVKATYDRTNDLFNVTVDGVTARYGYNERVYLTGDADTIGWAINGQLVSNCKDYTFFVNNDVTINKVTNGMTVEQEARQIAVSSTNGIYVITGMFTAGKDYTEVGFVFADGSINDDHVTLANTLVSTILTARHPVTNQIVINLNMSSYRGKKVRLYTRTGSSISYSNVITLS